MNPFFVATGWMIVGLCVLVVGGELLVRGASALAAAVRVSPLVIGLTVVAFGTSAPELAVSLQAVWTHSGDLALGNIVGSNIANVLLILGASSLVAPLIVHSQLVRFDVPFMIAMSALSWFVASDGMVSRWNGLLLFAILVTYVFWSVRQARRESLRVQQEFSTGYEAPPSGQAGLGQHFVRILVGLLMLTGGSRWLVGGASDVARLLGVSELVIGLTIVAFGTSLPEAVTSVIASLRGERDIAVGNVVGSNLFNLLAVLGLSSLFSPSGMHVSESALRFDLPVMMTVSVACLPIFMTGRRISRWEGGVFFAYYLIYLACVLVMALHPGWLSPQFAVTGLFVLPLSVITLAVIGQRLARGQRGGFGDSH
jgi:cation:H+ antiporter